MYSILDQNIAEDTIGTKLTEEKQTIGSVYVNAYFGVSGGWNLVDFKGCPIVLYTPWLICE